MKKLSESYLVGFAVVFEKLRTQLGLNSKSMMTLTGFSYEMAVFKGLQDWPKLTF